MPGFLTPPNTSSITMGVYAHSSARDAATPSPYLGLQVYLEDSGSVQFWNGSAWISIIQIANLDGGLPDTIYGGIPSIDAGGVL